MFKNLVRRRRFFFAPMVMAGLLWGAGVTAQATAVGPGNAVPQQLGNSIVGDNHYHSLSNNNPDAGPVSALEREGACANATGYADMGAFDSDHASQRWMFDDNGDGTATIRDSCNPVLVLAAPTDTGPVKMVAYPNQANAKYTKWTVTQTSTDAFGRAVYAIVSQATGKALESCGTAVGSTVVVDSPNNSAGQAWTVVYTTP
ncbi:RICIN domain-containing protein [Streptomyces sp. NPDC052396]|uniref:RICIN domain-containing protein n=1 Tax=Streptomyces sp. NPDC052396 TaxID=3365689 RepID=UPI0037D66956